MRKLISAMKLTKDMMDAPLDIIHINHYLDLYKSIGATHVDVSTVIGHPAYQIYTKLWMDAIHAKRMNVTLRSAHAQMEGLYGQTKAVGTLRSPLNSGSTRRSPPSRRSHG
jgi:hypothetical protein